MIDRIKCDKCGYEYHSCSIRECSHPAVNRRYGKNLCVYCCKKCDYVKRVGTGWMCTYENKED